MESTKSLAGNGSDIQNAALRIERDEIGNDKGRTGLIELSAAELQAVAGGPEGDVSNGVIP